MSRKPRLHCESSTGWTNLSIIGPGERAYIDVHLSDTIDCGNLNVYIPTQSWCSGTERLTHPEPWWRDYHFPGVSYVPQ
jgi:hypothetical protein